MPPIRLCFLLAFVLTSPPANVVSAVDFSQPGPWIVGHQTIQIHRANGPPCQTWIYFPAENVRTPQRLDVRRAPYPVVVFTSPVMPMTVYAQTLSHLASWGFVVVAPTDGMELLPDQSAIADDMRLCLDFLSAENVRPPSPFYGEIDTNRAGFCGHSWGGACSIIAGAKEPERVKIVLSLACWGKSTPSARSCVGNLHCPLLMLAGDDDVLTPLPGVQAIYDAAVPAKSLIVLRGGTHFGFIDNWLSAPAVGLSPHDRQLMIARHYMTAALLLHLQGRSELQPMLWGAGPADFGNVIRMIDLGNASPSVPNP